MNAGKEAGGRLAMKPKGNMFSSSDFKCPEMAHAVGLYPTPLLPCRFFSLLPGTV